jgi:intraflagellar transport protein 52
VVRTNYHKYFHPKECLISNGVLNRAISESAGKTIGYLTGEEGNNSQVFDPF